MGGKTVQKLIFDDGIQEFEVNGRAVLRFNPSDVNVYNRFFEVADEIEEMEREYAHSVREHTDEIDEHGFAKSGNALKSMREFDARVKARLSYIFGEENDFDRIMDGVNLFAVGKNGERVVTNVLAALQPIIEDGLRSHTQQKAQEAAQAAKVARERRQAK